MFADLLSSFLQSPHGESAATLLQDRHGLSADQASEALGHAGEAAAAAMHEQTAGHADPAAGAFSLLGGHAGSSFLMGALSGLARGESIGESLKDGLVGVVTGRVAVAIAVWSIAMISVRTNVVILAIGYPPEHQTPSLDADQWSYWRNSHSRFQVYFVGGLVSGIQQ